MPLKPTKLVGTDEMSQGSAGASGHFSATNTNHNVWLMGRAGQQRDLDGDSGYPHRCPLAYYPQWDAGGVPGWLRGRAGCPAGVYTHPYSVCAAGGCSLVATLPSSGATLATSAQTQGSDRQIARKP